MYFNRNFPTLPDGYKNENVTLKTNKKRKEKSKQKENTNHSHFFTSRYSRFLFPLATTKLQLPTLSISYQYSFPPFFFREEDFVRSPLWRRTHLHRSMTTALEVSASCRSETALFRGEISSSIRSKAMCPLIALCRVLDQTSAGPIGTVGLLSEGERASFLQAFHCSCYSWFRSFWRVG